MDEVDAPRIQPGLPVRISLSALPGRVFQGRVRRVAPYVTTVEKQARTVDIEVDFAEPAAARGLLVGYSADVEVVLARREGVMRVPNTALREGNRVLVLAPGRERLEARALRIGLTNWEYAEVLEGLSVGERVVTTADQDGIQAGTRVVAADGRVR
jgi:HlyD family secretion protein